MSHESVWLYAAESQPKPENIQPRIHSVSTNIAGSTPSHATAPRVRNQRAATKPASAMNAAHTAMSPTVRNPATKSGAPPMMRTAMYVQ